MRISHTFLPLVVSAVCLWGCGDSVGPVGQVYEWRGAVASGAIVEIKGINGAVVASRSRDGLVRLTARKSGPEDQYLGVNIDVVAHETGVTICAVYPNTPGVGPNWCGRGSEGYLSAGGSEVYVTFEVQIPEGVTFVGKTVNGSITVEDLDSDAEVSTVNGDVLVSTRRLAEASSVNGSVSGSIGQTDWDRPLEFSTVNGDVTVSIPPGTNAIVRGITVNGIVETDFNVTAVNNQVIQGKIGAGGPAMMLSTVNGDVRLERND